MAEGPSRTRLLAFTAELERLMIAYRMENGQLMWNVSDVVARDAVVKWAAEYEKQSTIRPVADKSRLDSLGVFQRRNTTVVDPAQVTERSEDGQAS